MFIMQRGWNSEEEYFYASDIPETTTKIQLLLKLSHSIRPENRKMWYRGLRKVIELHWEQWCAAGSQLGRVGVR
jgi:hypothetical protein